jgi:hypothetical protein
MVAVTRRVTSHGMRFAVGKRYAHFVTPLETVKR